jgi:ATP-dependent Clp protease ATP-binding subunit ClpC
MRGHEAASLGQLQHEHSRLEALWREASRLRSALLAAEELAMMALFEQQEVSPFVDDAHEQLQALRRWMPSVLLSLQPRRDQITLIVQEAGETRGLERWLLPLIADAPRRGWTVEGRLAVTSKSSDRARKWDDTLLGAEELGKAIAKPSRTFREVLLSVSGTYAGAFLALEAGPHRFTLSRDEEPVLLDVRPVAMSAQLFPKELALPAIAPPGPLNVKEFRLAPAVRDLRPDELLVCNGISTRLKLQLDGRDYFQELELILLEHLRHLGNRGAFDPESSPTFALDVLRGAAR